MKMHPYVPIELLRGNLGQRHKYINQCVKDATEGIVSFEDIKSAQEVYIVDRLFKIDVASKCRNVDYIIENLKEKNMLYVSRALKSTWLVTDTEYAHIINPRYLEEELFPAMLTTGVTKMRHFIYINLKDETRCFDFYQYHKARHNCFAAKHFLPKCSEDVIINEMELYTKVITPHYLKLLCEKCPRALTKYFNLFVNCSIKLNKFNRNIDPYLDIVRILLKSQPKLYFEIIERYCNSDRYRKRISPKATQYIMQKHKDRYLSKPELYGGALLHLPTLARCLAEEEAQELLLRLARARYLAPWFTLTYKSAEPLLNRISKEEKQMLVKKIFEDKNFGLVVTESPYELPVVPFQHYDKGLFSDSDNIAMPVLLSAAHCRDFSAMPKCVNQCANIPRRRQMSTLLDKLFDKYRFATFSKTYIELKKLMQSESYHVNRLMMLNVLVSKTLKCADHIQVLLELVSTRHANEPITLRASFIRSLVRRAAAYRLPDEPWQMFQKMVLQVVFQSEEKVPCDEGLHAILIHDILNDREVDPDIFKKFITVFNPLVEYDLSGKEKQKVYQALYSMLLIKSKSYLQEHNLNDVIEIIDKIFELLKAHKIDLGLCPEVIDIVKIVSEKDIEKSRGLLMRLYQMKKCRKTFTTENFILRQNNASYVNALRHDVHLLTDTNKFADLVMKGELKMDGFLIKLKIYFEDLVQYFKTLVEDKLTSKPGDATSLKLCRALCILKGPAVLPLIKDLYAGGKEDKQLAQRLAANVHMAWSVDGVQGIVYQDLGVVATCNALSTWPADVVRAQLPALLGGPAPLERLGVALALRKLPPDDIMNVDTHVRQSARRRTKRVLLKNFYKYIHLKGESLRLDLWDRMKELMIELCPHYNEKQWKVLSDSTGVPDVIKVEYCLTVLSIHSSKAFKFDRLTNLIINLNYLCTKLSELNEADVLRVLKPFLEYKFKNDNVGSGRDNFLVHNIYLKILTRFLLTCETEAIQNARFETVGLVFINNIKNSWHYTIDRLLVRRCLSSFIFYLKYNPVFLNDILVNCLPLFNKIVDQMHMFLDVKQSFKFYSHVQLTMVYYKALQEVKKEQPRLLSEQLNSAETAAAVGRAFGRHLAEEHRQLVANHFPSVSYIYVDDACDYIRQHFGFGKYSKKFIIAVIQGVAQSGENDDLYFATLILQNMGYLNDLTLPELKDVLDLITDSKDAQMQAFWSVSQCLEPLSLY